MWEFLLNNRDKCTAYIQYYYSPYFTKCSLQSHKARFVPVVAKFDDAFKEEANTWMLLNHILSTMLNFAVKVYDGQLPNDTDTAERVFRVVYYSVRPYFKHAKEESCYA